MKGIFTFLFFSVVMFASAQSTFKAQLNVSNNSEFAKIVQDDDGSFIAVGQSANNLNDDILISRFSSSGILLSTKTINTNGFDRGYSIIKTRDKGFAISGELDHKLAVLKLDKSLNLVWKKHYSNDNSYSYRNEIIQLSDGSFIVVGSSYNSDRIPIAYLLRIDGLGNVLASKKYFNPADYNKVVSIKPTKDGNCVMLVSAKTVNTNKYGTHVVKIKPTGDVIWSKYFNDSDRTTYPSSIIQASDGNLVITGGVLRNFSDGTRTLQFEQAMIAKFDANGNFIWGKYITDSSPNDNDDDEIIENKNGDYVLCGEYASYKKSLLDNDITYSVIAKISKDGNVLNLKALDSSVNTSVELEGLIQTNDGYAACGSRYIDNEDESNYGVLYKFDSNFSICGYSKNLGSLVSFGTVVAETLTADSVTVVASIPTIDSAANETASYLCNSVLPVHFLSFDAALQNKSVSIGWKTANEVNTDYFVVEKSSNGTSFSTLQKILAKGNSSNVEAYAITDFQPLTGTSYYRLKSVDKDGSVTYSSIVPVTVMANGTIVINPNPAHNNIHVLMQSAVASNITFSVMDITGKLLVTQSATVNAGTNTISIPATSLNKGLYVLKITDNHTTQSLKFIKE